MKPQIKDWELIKKSAEDGLKRNEMDKQINETILKLSECQIKTMSKDEEKNTNSVKN